MDTEYRLMTFRCAEESLLPAICKKKMTIQVERKSNKSYNQRTKQKTMVDLCAGISHAENGLQNVKFQ